MSGTTERPTEISHDASDKEKEAWLIKTIEKELSTRRISQFETADGAFLELVCDIDDDGCYYKVKPNELSGIEELYYFLFKEWPPYFTQEEKDTFYV